MEKNKKLTIALVAGETSGDILGAGLIKTIKKLHPNSCFVGIAGPQMQDEGCEAWYQMEELSVMGIVEVFCKLRRILSIRRKITKQIIELKPDIFIGIDAPDFNLDLEGKLKRSGIKTIHYVSPSVWAWKQKRVFKIKRNTNLILAFLPFEKVFYDKFNVPCQFIGHKMADDVPLAPDHNYQRERLNIPNGVQVLSILVGSRHAEVSLLTEPFLKAAQMIKQTIPNLHIIVPLVNEKRKKEFLRIKSCVAPDFNVQILDGQAREAMIASDVAILASGTVALECMLAKCPMVVGYKMKPFTFWLAKKLIKTPYVSLPNILSGKAIVPELLQNDCTPENLSKQAIKLLSSDNSQLKKNFLSLHNQIRCNADDQAAKAVLKIIGINDNEI